MILLLNKSFLYSWGWIRSWQATTLMTSQRRWSQIFKNLFLCFLCVGFTVPVELFHNARLRRIMILNNFLTMRWSWTSCEATWRGSRGVRRSQLPARRWYQGGTSLYVLYFIKVEPLFLAAMIVCALWWETRKKQEHVVCIICFHLQGANRSSTHTRRR